MCNSYTRLRIFTLFEYAAFMAATLIISPETVSDERKLKFRVHFPSLASVPTCTNCGLKASFVAHEKCNHTADVMWTIYGIDPYNQEVNFTVDHTVAQSHGGSSKSLSNLTSMCYPCNNTKSQIEQAQIKMVKRRELVQNMKHRISKIRNIRLNETM